MIFIIAGHKDKFLSFFCRHIVYTVIIILKLKKKIIFLYTFMTVWVSKKTFDQKNKTATYFSK